MKTENGNTLQIIDPDAFGKDRGFTPGEMQVLDLINQRVSGAVDLGEIIDLLFAETRKIMSCDRIDVAFVEDDNQRMVLYYVKTDYEPLFLMKGFASDIMGGSIQRVFQYGYPSVIDDMAEHARQNPQSDSARLLVKEGIRSSMVCPLAVDGRPIAMLMCRSKKPGAYGAHEVRLHLGFASRLSQAVEKAYHIVRLSSAMNSYMEMLSFVSHELKNPISSIITLGNTLAAGYFGDISDKQRSIIMRLVKKAEYVLNLTGEYLNLANFETGEFTIKPREVDFFHDVVSHSLEIVAALMDENKIAFEQDIRGDLSGVICDPELMKIVVTNLLSNGIKYGNTGGILKLNVLAEKERIRLSVWNSGPGFPESQKARLFRRFSKIQTPELMERRGHGVGLYVTWKIIQLHGGRIWADSNHGEWAEFILEVPRLMDRCLLQ